MTGMLTLLLKKVSFNDPFDLNALNVANRGILKCKRAAKVENGGGDTWICLMN